MKYLTKAHISFYLVLAISAWGLLSRFSPPSTCDLFSEVDIESLSNYPDLADEYAELKGISRQCDTEESIRRSG